MAGARGAGNGPLCPANPIKHGNLFSKDRGGDPSKGWRCMHSAHGGNGRGFTDQQVRAYELTEEDIMGILQDAAQDVADEKTDLDSAAAAVARVTKRGATQVRAQILDVVNEIKANVEAKAADQAAQKEASMAKPKPAEKPARVTKEHVEPAEFKAARDERGLSNKEVSAALEAAGMGSTLSRVTELTHSKGSSRDLFTKFVAALDAYQHRARAKNPNGEA